MFLVLKELLPEIQILYAKHVLYLVIISGHRLMKFISDLHEDAFGLRMFFANWYKISPDVGLCIHWDPSFGLRQFLRIIEVTRWRTDKQISNLSTSAESNAKHVAEFIQLADGISNMMVGTVAELDLRVFQYYLVLWPSLLRLHNQ
jgi:hypothetical protein